MRILVLGGTAFLGRAAVEYALAQGHAVTTFTRGRTGAPPDGATALRGNRNNPEDLDSALAGREFDAIIDTSCQAIRAAELAAARFATISSYVFVSTMCVYRDFPPGPIVDETPPVKELSVGDYGAMKAASEAILGNRLGDRLVTARAGVIVGPRDNMGLLPWWLRRIAAGGPIPVPERLDVGMSLIDVRDVAQWLVLAAERRYAGPVNLVGDTGAASFELLLKECADIVLPDSRTAAEFVPVPDRILLREGVDPYAFHLPFWFPEETAETIWRVGSSRARELGLTTRPLRRTVADTWPWLRNFPMLPIKPGVPVPGLSPAVESRLLMRSRVR